MPCHLPATSVTSHRRKQFSKSPSIIAAKLDMTRPGERWAQSFMVWAATGAHPAWKPLAVARRKDSLVVLLSGERGPMMSDRTESLRSRYPATLFTGSRSRSERRNGC